MVMNIIRDLARFFRQYEPESMNHPGNSAKNCKEYIEPEVCTDSDLQKSCYRWNYNCQDNFQDEHKYAPFSKL